MFILATIGLATPALAQSGTQPTQQQDTTKGALPIDRWVSKPTSIVLAPEQKAKFDSVRSDYAREYAMMPTDPSKGGMPVTRGSELDEKYKAKVRDLLTPIQQVVFDKNFAAEYAMGGRKRP
jgi:hypothetical protein